VWAHSHDLQLSAGEVNSIFDCFNPHHDGMVHIDNRYFTIKLKNARSVYASQIMFASSDDLEDEEDEEDEDDISGYCAYDEFADELQTDDYYSGGEEPLDEQSSMNVSSTSTNMSRSIISALETPIVAQAIGSPGESDDSRIVAIIKKYLDRSLDNAELNCDSFGGIVIVKTKQTVIFGLYSDKQPAGLAHKTVEMIADYLLDLGF